MGHAATLTFLACALFAPGCVGTQGRAPDSSADTDIDSDTEADSDSNIDTATDSGPDTGPAPPPEMVLVPASTFQMGCNPDTSDDGCFTYEHEHTVTLSHDYHVGVTEVTQGQFSVAMGYNPSDSVNDLGPVMGVSWYEAVAYANLVSREAGLTECYACTGHGDALQCDVAVNPYECDGYRLLTEAEWEGAARCGTDQLYAGSDTVGEVAWTAENSGGGAHPVAELAPNACGTFDMSGNLSEWTQDLWDGQAGYLTGAVTDPTGDSSGEDRAFRGGTWELYEVGARVYTRYYCPQGGAMYSFGFRLGRTAA